MFSTNQKDIGTIYFIVAAVPGIIGTAVSIIGRMESEAIYLAGNELNGYIAAYAILMIFFIAKPELTMAYTAP